jgi:integrase
MAKTAKKNKPKNAQRSALARKSPFLQPSKNTLKKRGYFAGEEIVETQRQHLEPEELRRFFKAMPRTDFWYPYFFLQFYFGCRLSEPALMFDEDVSFDKKMIVIKRLKKTSETSGFCEHIYQAPPVVLACVQVALRTKQERLAFTGQERQVEGAPDRSLNPFLFPSTRQSKDGIAGAERLSQLRNSDGFQAVSRFTAHRQFQRLALAAKLPEHLSQSHVLRHTRATLMLAAGVAPESVQVLLGHSNLKMTLRYLGTALALRSRSSKEDLAMGAI